MRMKLKTVLITTSLLLLVLVLIVFQDVSYQIFETLALTYIEFENVFENVSYHVSYQIVETWETWVYGDRCELRLCIAECILLPDGKTCAPCIQPPCLQKDI